MKTFLTSILLVVCCFGQAAEYHTDSLYSKWIINSRIGDFRNKSKTEGFKTPTSERINSTWDYVPGLVGKGILKAWEQYQDSAWSTAWFDGIQDYADNITMTLGYSNIDDLNAAKIYFELYRGAIAKGETVKAAAYRKNADSCRNKLKTEHLRIAAPLPGVGGFWHKYNYTNQMWLDGLYMGAAMYAEWQGNFGKADDVDSWNDIALQFDIVFAHTWDADKELCYHAWSAEPSNLASAYWANTQTGQSQEFWARGMGWFFAALVDALEYMPDTLSAYMRLNTYANQVAKGLQARQDSASGCWYQLLQYNSTQTSSCRQNNYLESSASSMFTYAYLKGIRLHVLDSITYMPTAQKAYQGLIKQFVVEETGGTLKLIQSCESAGLSSSRKGDADYYLCGSDVTINNNTEGKVLGPFIMASVEYERVTNKSKTANTEINTNNDQTKHTEYYFSKGIIWNRQRQTLKIYTENGSIVLESNRDIDMRDLPKGLYIVKSRQGNTTKILL